MKRKPHIAKGLAKNSKSAMLAAIEIHNKPSFPYRYEVVVLLVLNSWELILKAYIYKNLKKVKLFHKDGTSKPFLECLECVTSNLGKNYQAVHDNIVKLYEYRNTVAHFYTDTLDILVFSLLKKNVLFYKYFLEMYFDIDITDEPNLILLPIGFKKFYSPLDFLSNESAISESPEYIKLFVKSIIDSTEKLSNQGIDESILVDFRMNLINEKRTKNADIIAGINNAKATGVTFDVKNEVRNVSVTDNPLAPVVRLTRKTDGTTGVLFHEELSAEIFCEINNVLDANKYLSNGNKCFVLSESIYYRIYSERQHVEPTDDNLEILFRASLYEFYSPNLFWLLSLPSQIIAEQIIRFLGHIKTPQIGTILRLFTLLGPEASNWLYDKFYKKWNKTSQPPEYYFTFQKIREQQRTTDRKLLALRKSISSKIEIQGHANVYTLKELIKSSDLSSGLLSDVCLRVVEGHKNQREIARLLDIITYGDGIQSRSEEITDSIKSFDSETGNRQIQLHEETITDPM